MDRQTYRQMDIMMEGRKDRWTDGRMDVQTYRCTDRNGQTDGQIDRQMDRRTKERKDRWRHGWMDGQTDERMSKETDR